MWLQKTYILVLDNTYMEYKSKKTQEEYESNESVGVFWMKKKNC